MQVDFYHLTRDPVENVVPMLAEKCLDAGKRLLLVCGDHSKNSGLSQALWTKKADSFLAHDFAGSERQVDQPILISDHCEANNGAKYIMLSDGEWREEALQFERVFYLFTAAEIDEARTAWRELDGLDDVTPRYWKQDGGRWVEGP